MNNKPYNTLNDFFNKKFGSKVFKISIDGGFNCPNRDGKIGVGGCIFCNEEGSGEFAGDRNKSINEQYNDIKEKLSKKLEDAKYIVHFQAFTNTYAPVEILKQKYNEALQIENTVGLAIATRPDCISDEVLDLLQKINKEKYIFIELGLQTTNDITAKRINRGYDLECFVKCVNKLRKRNIDVVVHVIIGLPGESYKDYINTINFLAHQDIQGIKIHLLYVVKNTYLEELYNKGEFMLLEKDDYITIVADCIERLRPDIVVHRMTGDGKKTTLVGPWWSLDKMRVLSAIEKELLNRKSYQGKKYIEN